MIKSRIKKKFKKSNLIDFALFTRRNPWGIRNDDAEIVDVMQLFAPVYGDRDYEENYPC